MLTSEPSLPPHPQNFACVPTADAHQLLAKLNQLTTWGKGLARTFASGPQATKHTLPVPECKEHSLLNYNKS